jgi:hypothetical protein
VGRNLQAPEWLAGGGDEDGGIEDGVSGEATEAQESPSQFSSPMATFDDAMYTTKLDSNTVTDAQRQKAEELAVEMEEEGQHEDMEEEAGVLHGLDALLAEGDLDVQATAAPIETEVATDVGLPEI